MITTPLTELDAVNMALDTIGESPLSTLNFVGVSDASTAYRKLVNTNRTVQEYGWTFNKEYKYPLLVTPDGYIELPPNTLFVNPSDATLDYVQRGNRLYDRTNHTFIFTTTVYVEIIFLLPFEELPSYARSYISIVAAREFQKGILGSQVLDNITEDVEAKAHAVMMSREISAGNYNFLDAYDIAVARRRIP